MPEPKVQPGTKVKLSLVDLIKPWIGATVYVTFTNGQTVHAKILEVKSDHAELVVIKDAPSTG